MQTDHEGKKIYVGTTLAWVRTDGGEQRETVHGKEEGRGFWH